MIHEQILFSLAIKILIEIINLKESVPIITQIESPFVSIEQHNFINNKDNSRVFWSRLKRLKPILRVRHLSIMINLLLLNNKIIEPDSICDPSLCKDPREAISFISNSKFYAENRNN